jgi:ABC-type multidrug transport system permease subunit
LVDREVHVSNLLVGNVAMYLTGAGGALMWSVKTAGVAIPPVVVSLDKMRWVVALSTGCVIVASTAPSGIVAVAAGAVTIVLWCRVCGVGLSDGQGRWWWWHLERRGWHVVD